MSRSQHVPTINSPQPCQCQAWANSLTNQNSLSKNGDFRFASSQFCIPNRAPQEVCNRRKQLDAERWFSSTVETRQGPSSPPNERSDLVEVISIISPRVGTLNASVGSHHRHETRSAKARCSAAPTSHELTSALACYAERSSCDPASQDRG